MNSHFFKIVCTGLAALIWSGAGLAHEESSPLGVSVTATDVHTISCFNDGNGTPAFLLFELVAGAPANGPVVSAQILVPDKQIVMNVTDPVSGDLAGSGEVRIDGGTSPYRIIVNKAGAGKAFYTMTYHCETAGSIHTGTDQSYSQNQ